VGVDLVKLKSDLNFLINTSLLFLKEKNITKVIDRYDFISGIQIKKNYPNILKILVYEKKPVAIEIQGKLFFYITKNGEKITYSKLNVYEKLPIIFGNHKNFNIFFKDLEEINFQINDIKAFYYFDVGRWDIELKNGTTIRLPKKNYRDILLKVNTILNDTSFSKYKIFDYRIKNQLILQ
jgi:cell division septal protein FtsQ